MPPQPEAFPDMSANPSLQPEDWLAIFGEAVVPPPATHVAQPVVSQLVTGSTLTTSPFLPHLRFELLQALRCRFDLSFAVQSKPQELALPGPPNSAFGSIHLQSQMLLDPSLYRLHHPLPRRLTAYVDIAVIRVPADLVPSPFQFPIQLVQVDVRQQW